MYPVRVDFFGDEIDEIRRIVPSTGQTVSTLQSVEVYPVTEFSCARSSSLALARRSNDLRSPTRLYVTFSRNSTGACASRGRMRCFRIFTIVR